MKKFNHIEPLEERIAPATIVNPYTVTFQNYETNSGGTQIQGDTVVVKVSKPLFATVTSAQHILQFTDSTGSSLTDPFTGNSSAENLSEINLQGIQAAQGVNISVTVIPQVGIGQQTVDVGSINAGDLGSGAQANGNIDLGSVYIEGNLGGITAGNDFSAPAAIRSLTALSMSGSSIVLGSIVKMNVEGNFTGFMEVIGYQFGSIGHLNIGGTMTGDTSGDTFSGYIQYSGHIGSATIGNLLGSSANNTGELVGPQDQGAGGIGALHVTGSITGGAGEQSGGVFVNAGNIGRVTVDGSLIGSSGQESGVISANLGSIGVLRVGGSINGGTGVEAGVVSVAGNLGSMQVLGSISGGSGVDTGLVSVVGHIGNLAVTGSLNGGTAGTAADTSTGAAAVHGFSGIIEAQSAVHITIGGSIVGGTPNTSMVTSDGTVDATADTSGEILVNSVTSINIAGGITANGGPSNAAITGESGAFNTHYGSIVVGGDVAGGAGNTSGSILIGSANSVHIGGNLTGGAGTASGWVSTELGLGTAFVGGNVTGSSGTDSGEISAGGILTNLHIGGNLVGGTADFSGIVMAGGALKNGVILGNLDGNAPGTPISSTSGVMDVGYVQAGSIGALDIAGSVNAGINSSGPIADSGAIRTTANIASLTIGGAVTGTAANPVFISAQQGPGNAPHPASDLAIGNVTIHGAADYLDILAGYSPPSTIPPSGQALGVQSDGAAQIGTLDFLSTLTASNLVAGAAAPDSNGQFGTSGTTAFAPRPGITGLISSIASVTVMGVATGDTTPADSFGVVAEKLGTIEVNKTPVPTNNLTPGTPVLVPASNNLFLLEPLAT